MAPAPRPSHSSPSLVRRAGWARRRPPLRLPTRFKKAPDSTPFSPGPSPQSRSSLESPPTPGLTECGTQSGSSSAPSSRAPDYPLSCPSQCLPAILTQPGGPPSLCRLGAQEQLKGSVGFHNGWWVSTVQGQLSLEGGPHGCSSRELEGKDNWKQPAPGRGRRGMG